MSAATPAYSTASARRSGTSGVFAARWPTGLGITATVASLALAAPLPDRMQTWISAWGVVTAAVIYLAWGAARGELDDRRWLTAQTTAVLGYAAVAIAAVADVIVAATLLTVGTL